MTNKGNLMSIDRLSNGENNGLSKNFEETDQLFKAQYLVNMINTVSSNMMGQFHLWYGDTNILLDDTKLIDINAEESN